jgi:predicted transcriptional regulator
MSLGSLHYLKKLRKSQNVNDLEIIAVLKEKKPYFKDKDIAWAWQKLEMI